MIGIELVKDRNSRQPFSADIRLGQQITRAARQRGAFIRGLGDVVVLMPAPAMPVALIDRLCDIAFESIVEVTERLSQSS